MYVAYVCVVHAHMILYDHDVTGITYYCHDDANPFPHTPPHPTPHTPHPPHTPHTYPLKGCQVCCMAPPAACVGFMLL